MSYNPELQQAIYAVREASQLCQNVRAEWAESNAAQKSDKSPVTIADFGAQALIISRICEQFPGDEIIAEETSEMLRSDSSNLAAVTEHVGRFREANPNDVLKWIDSGQSNGGDGRFWSLDPIDGTKGYVRNEQYAVSLGLHDKHGVKFGVLGCPNYPQDSSKPNGPKGVLFFAQRGQNLRAIALDNPARRIEHIDPPIPRMVQRREVNDAAFNHRVANELGLTEQPLSIDSQVKYGTVALGEAQIYLRLKPGKKEFIWDHLPGVAIAQAAGARVTDVNGKNLDFTAGRTLSRNEGIVVSKGLDHRKVIAVLQRVMQAG